MRQEKSSEEEKVTWSWRGLGSWRALWRGDIDTESERMHSVWHMEVEQGLPWWLSGKEYPLTVQETQETPVRSLGWEDPLEEGMATHSSILAWKIPWREETGKLQSIGLQRVRHD